MFKKLTLSLFLLCAAPLAALPLGNPADPALYCNGLFLCEDPCCGLDWHVRVGFYGDYVFNRHLELKHRGGDKFETTQIYTNAGYLALNLCNRVDFFATLGATSIYYETSNGSFSTTDTSGRSSGKFDTDFSYSVGLRGLIWQCGCFYLGGEFQYFYTEPDIMRTTTTATTSVYPDNAKSKYREWQLGLGLAYRIWNLIPYAGIKWAHVQFQLPESANTDLQNDKDWGYAIGTTLVACNMATLSVEARFADEKAVYVNGQLRF